MPNAPELTIAVLQHHLRGYPEDCLESLAPAPAGTEFLLVQTDSLAPLPARGAVRVVPVPASLSGAAAKNLAVAEARGEFLLLATADTVARPGAVGLLHKFLAGRDAPAIVSAQLLNENGMRRRTSFPMPSIAREINPSRWLRRPRRSSLRSLGPPSGGPAFQAAALHATFLMARRETFRSVGEFAEGYRFAFEDVDWCRRARQKSVALCVCPDAQAFKTAPQLCGELAPEVRALLEISRLRCVRAARGAGYAELFRAVRRSKSLAAWLAAASLSRLFCGNSDLLANRAAVHRAIWKLPADAPSPPGLAPDLESHVVWEMTV